MRILQHITNTNRHVWLVLGNSNNWELTEGTDIYIVQLHLVELIAVNFEILGYKNHRKETWQFLKFQTVVRTEPKMSVIKLSR